jgi:polar amino acid transport system permease protein
MASGLIDFLQFGWGALPELLSGLAITILLWVPAILIGLVLGLMLAWARLYGNSLFYALSTGYIELFRGTPMLIQMLALYLGLPDLGITLTPFVAAVIAIGLNSAAYQAEYFRGAIQSIPSGQMAAARACGMNRAQALRHIILPQALRRVIPQWSNEAILELKFTSIAYAIGVVELTAQAEMIGYTTFRFFEAFLLIAIIYLAVTNIVAFALDALEAKTRIPGLNSPVEASS